MYKQYENYKDSGVEWFGEIPEHWEVTKLKRIAILKYGDSLPTDSRIDGEVSVFGSGGVIGCNHEANTDSPVIIIGRKGSYGSLFYSEAPVFAIDTTYYIDLLNCNETLQWLYYLLPSLELNKLSQDTGVPGLSRDFAYEKYVPKPNFKEQNDIVHFISKKTSEIDSLIADKEELIKKLEEYKQSIITEAVTKGLNPDVKMKDSGIKWIGEIPEHWEVVQIRRLLKNGSEGIKIGPFGSQLKLEQLEASGYRVYGQENLIKNDFSIGNRFLSDDKYGELKVYRVEPGDLLISMMGTIGRTSIVPKEIEEGIMDSHLIRLRFKDEILTMFVNALFCNAKYLIYQNQLLSKGTIMSGLNSTIVKNIIVVVPPYGEQLEILNEINRAIRSCESLANDVQDQLYNLKFYRQSLIFEAVTGKIDVRDYQHERSEQLA